MGQCARLTALQPLWAVVLLRDWTDLCSIIRVERERVGRLSTQHIAGRHLFPCSFRNFSSYNLVNFWRTSSANSMLLLCHVFNLLFRHYLNSWISVPTWCSCSQYDFSHSCCLFITSIYSVFLELLSHSSCFILREFTKVLTIVPLVQPFTQCHLSILYS